MADEVHQLDAFFYVFCVKIKGHEYIIVDLPPCFRKQHEVQIEASFEDAKRPMERVASRLDLRSHTREHISSKKRQCMSFLF
jgi:hypothetical protein